MIVIYTDGSARKNGSKDAEGGFGVVICKGEAGQKPEEYKVIGAYSEMHSGITNNRMEMEAILYALEHYGSQEGDFFVPIVYSDSTYCINSFTEWIRGWKAKGWVRAGNKPIENLDLVKKYDKLSQSFKIDLRYVKGHDKNIWNNIADALATGRMSPQEVMEEYGGM